LNRIDEVLWLTCGGGVCAMPKSTRSDVRSIITDDEFGGFRITVPASAKARAIAGIGLAVWICVFVFTLRNLDSRPASSNFEPIKILFLWTAGGITLGAVGVTGYLHRDTVIIEGKSLVLRKEFAFFHNERTFELSEIRNLRPAPLDDPSGAKHHPTSITFDHKGETYQFGCALSEPEVMRLVKTIRSRFPIRDDWNEAEPLPVIR
jgi:hypothetical protein